MKGSVGRAASYIGTKNEEGMMVALVRTAEEEEDVF